MNKKITALLMAALFAVLFAFPAGAETYSKSYNAGYIHLNYNYFHTGYLTKQPYYTWIEAKDKNTETKFVNSDGNESLGSHYTRVESGDYVLTSEQSVPSGYTITFNSFFSNYAQTKDPIRLRIRNGATEGQGYRTKGKFLASVSDGQIM